MLGASWNLQKGSRLPEGGQHLCQERLNTKVYAAQMGSNEAVQDLQHNTEGFLCLYAKLDVTDQLEAACLCK